MNHSRIYFFLIRLFTPIGRLFFWVHYLGKENIPSHGGYIVCSNHKSVFDPFLLALPFRHQIRYMAKMELFTDHGPVAKAFLQAMGAFPVHRNMADRKSMRTAEQILKDGGVVGIFPQGGCVFDNTPFRPKPGVALLAERSGASVLPAAICCNGILRPFKRITIRFGKPMQGRQLSLHGTSVAGMRQAAEELADRINSMLEGKP